MLLLHQFGYCCNRNLNALSQGIGDGAILSPVTISPRMLNSTAYGEIVNRSIFDPELYVPSYARSNLNKYSFHQTMQKAVKGDALSVYRNVCNNLLELMQEIGFTSIVIPAEYSHTPDIGYYSEQKKRFADLILEELDKSKLGINPIQTLLISEAQLSNEEELNNVLSWITGQTYIQSVYLIFVRNNPSGHITSKEFLAGALTTIHALRVNGISVVVGYCGLERMLFSIAGPTAISIGIYDKLRSYQIGRFDKQPKQISGPPLGIKARILSPQLIQIVRQSTFDNIRKKYPKWIALQASSSVSKEIFDEKYEWKRDDPKAQLHNLTVQHNYVKGLSADLKKRRKDLRTQLSNSLIAFKSIRQAGVPRSDDFRDSHLVAWIEAIERYENNVKYLDP